MWLNKYGSSFIFIVGIFCFLQASTLLLRFFFFSFLSELSSLPPSNAGHLPFNATVITCDDQSSCCSCVCVYVDFGILWNITVLHIADHVKKKDAVLTFNDLKGDHRRMYSLVYSVFGSCRLLCECVCVCLARRCKPLQSETVPVWASEPALNLYSV